MLLKSFLILAVISAIGCQSYYDQELAINLCRLTVASYCNPAKIKDWTCKPCADAPLKMDNVQIFKNSTGAVVGFIGTSPSPSAIYLIFRGIMPWDIANWISSIDFIKVGYPYCTNGCQVQRGFYHEYQDIAIQVINTVKNYQVQFGFTQVIVAGHSLGGVLATHAAAQLVREGIHVHSLYTFGSPKAGDQRFSAWFETFIRDRNSFRVTHARDPVPHSPSPVLGFHQVAHEVFYKAGLNSGYVDCNDDGSREDPNCSNKFIANVVITDHLTYYDIDFSGIILGCQ